MARARIVLRSCETFTPLSGETWRKGQARTIADPSQIAYYRGQSEFSVTILEDPKPKPKPEPPPDPTGGGTDGGGEGDGDEVLTEAALGRLTKAQLVDLAAERWGLALDEDEMKKDDLVSAILKAQG